MSASDDLFIQRLTQITGDNLQNEQFGVSELAKEAGLNRSTLHRRIKLVTGKSASQFIREQRLKKAKELLKEQNLSASEIAYLVGFGSVSYFSKCYHDFFGFPPGKTSPDNEEANNELRATNNQTDFKRKHIFKGIIVLLLILTLGTLLIILSRNRHQTIENSVAIPAILNYNLSDEEQFYVDVFREELLIQLSQVENFKVPLKETVDRLRDSELTISELGKKLNVNYIIIGSSRKIEGEIWIQLQLVKVASEKILWADNFKLELKDKNIFKLHDEIADAVIKKIDPFLTPVQGEKETIPFTQNITAYNFYQMGKRYMELYELDVKRQNLLDAKLNFDNALRFDTNYSLPYVGLGQYYFYLSNSEDIILPQFDVGTGPVYQPLYDVEKSRQYLDSALNLSNKAVEINSQTYDAYLLQGIIYTEKGMPEKSVESLLYAISLEPENYKAYYYLAYNYSRSHNFSAATEYLLKSIKLSNEPLINEWILKKISDVLQLSGFPDVAKQYLDKLLKQDNDSINYLIRLCVGDIWNGNPEGGLKKAEEAYMLDTANLRALVFVGWSAMYVGDTIKMKDVFQKYDAITKKYNLLLEPNIYFGYFYHLFGTKEEADFHLNRALTADRTKLNLNHPEANTYHFAYYFACYYSIMGDKKKAIENLKILTQKEKCPVWMVTYFKQDPLLKNIRNEPEFDEVYNVLKRKYQQEHERVKDILIREGIINN